jgi:hypothetical protein
MNNFIDSFRVVLWFVLCVVMAVGMLAFALLYGLFSYVLKKFAWKDDRRPVLSLKFAK